jgi:hypothetical protein
VHDHISIQEMQGLIGGRTGIDDGEPATAKADGRSVTRFNEQALTVRPAVTQAVRHCLQAFPGTGSRMPGVPNDANDATHPAVLIIFFP